MIRKKRTRPRARILFRPSDAEPRSGQPVAMGGNWLVVGYRGGTSCVLAGLATKREAEREAGLLRGGDWLVAVERSV